ncbi:hypothetical protein ACIQXD_26540 [Streptomyces uncialis]|uniref:hypothetical protein n=1 Tax=Streptomyces uncialis TaxID=1048205 RepID=UPI00380FF76F
MHLIPGRAAAQGMDGTVRIPVRLVRNGRRCAETDIVLTPPQAAWLARELAGDLPHGPGSLLRELSRGHVVAAGPGVTVVSKFPR